MKTLYNELLNYYVQLSENIQNDEIVLEYMAILSRLFLLNLQSNDNYYIESFNLLFESLRVFIYYRFNVEIEKSLYSARGV